MVDCSWWCWLAAGWDRAQLVVTHWDWGLELGTLSAAGLANTQHSLTTQPALPPITELYSLATAFLSLK